MGEEQDPEFALIIEATGLDNDQLENLKKGFEGFDKDGSNSISQTSMQMILKSMSIKVDKDDMDMYVGEIDEEASGKFSFYMFCQVAAKIMIEDDEGQMKEELKEAFRIYDRSGQGFITTNVLKEILREIDQTLTEDDLLNIVDEVDEDGSGTLDFDEFQEMMMG
jgi:Ca2+-binding EF-hand superfamily protein